MDVFHLHQASGKAEESLGGVWHIPASKEGAGDVIKEGKITRHSSKIAMQKFTTLHG